LPIKVLADRHFSCVTKVVDHIFTNMLIKIGL
jgi:hypothetical protein